MNAASVPNTAEPALFLIGPRASGKSGLGRALASHIGWDFDDADEALERLHGRSIAEWLPVDEAGFRQAELRLLESWLTRAGCVLALGGGVVENETAVDWLAAQPRVILLWASVEELTRRQEGSARPALTELSLTEEVRTVFERRRAAYERAANGRSCDTGGDFDGALSRLLAMFSQLRA